MALQLSTTTRNRHQARPIMRKIPSRCVQALVVLLFLLLLDFIRFMTRPRHEREAVLEDGTVRKEKDSVDLYAITPFCNKENGTCGESPTTPTPRTIYSSKSAPQHKKWLDYNHQLQQNAKFYAENRKNNQDARPWILLGDSITEAWVGTSYGTVSERAKGIPKVLHEWMQQSTTPNNHPRHFDPLVLGISGDQTQHLLWRLQNGHLQSSYTDNPKTIFVVLIGTNNLGAGELPGPTSEGILAVLEYLVANTRGNIVYLEVLPRDDTHNLQALCPPRCDKEGQAFRSFLPAIDKVNELVRQKMGDSSTLSKRVWSVPCGDKFLIQQEDGKKAINDSLFSDRLHPNVEGHQILAHCIQSVVQQKEQESIQL